MNELDRRDFLRLAAAAAVTLSVSAQETPEVEELTIAAMQEGMRSGRFTARRLAELHLARIASIDRQLRSIIEINPDALTIADALDRERKAGRVRGSMHGIPIVIKDNIDTADRMHTTAGSLALADSIATRDAHLVRRLREAGAVILGKTNLSEWANFRSTHSTSGWSARGGLTRNPYALDRNACGSSTGSGAAVAASLAAAAIGTETDGSIVCPSTSCGIVGLKPTLGLVSRSGIIPISHSQDTAGPMARTVTDTAILLGAITGIDSLDAVTLSSRGRVHADYTQFLDPHGLRGARIGVARQYFGFSDRVDAVMKDAIAAIEKLGATIVDEANLATKGQFDESAFEVLLSEFKHD
ncbi:MAG: amidase family protein, partial [Thermoanaerobaculia bacterium]